MKKSMVICFQFGQRNYLAMVSCKKGANNETEYGVRLLHDSLLRIIPQGEFSCDQAASTQGLNHPLAGELIRSVNQSLSEHLKCVQA